ncbi:MAG: phosphate/phosphite/phosphonate ABC transporter substrate-binding protein [Candidatus Omnitrophica bacterium]|nr:phosphate/phosphite/phosphonate ABC transporter substrate-binding protein [Candidatus Omnitrophota bacterium]MBU4303816.1 phosphate/phosphite/phosphonate ABC transporter substrate-binding protein [Candidatus Omnitrophota bacterium]MBU4418759.1 phosphate/phosphite/phosphonate ABC transporter substrate-binding protein [Candidatus Omnitrophota bacterium]MBU4468007.1 phosphate/phosphite/phosphonate ABC transporter substrate-binding protein [Candidatus Omnitrophota bacterium]MCG2707804.1 phosphat
MKRVLSGVMIAAVAVMGVVLFMHSTGEKAKKVDFSKVEVGETLPQDKETIRIAVSAMISPKETISVYKKILDYIGRKLGKPVELIQRKTYTEVNDLIEKGEIDTAFVCTGPYIQGRKKFGLEVLVAPEVRGESVYYAYIIVRKNSSLQDFTELKGKSFAFTDPLSNTGCFVIKYALAKMGQTPESFFKNYIFTNGHDNSIQAVAEGVVDGAAVDHLVWEYLHATNPQFTAQTKIIKKIGPFGMPPFVCRPGYNPLMKEKIKQVLLDMHKDQEGKDILSKLFIDRFITVDDSSYDSVRQMQDWIENNEATKDK